MERLGDRSLRLEVPGAVECLGDLTRERLDERPVVRERLGGSAHEMVTSPSACRPATSGSKRNAR